MSDIQTGTKSINTLFKNKNDVDNISNRIDQNEKLVRDMSALYQVITVHLAEREVPVFKKEKALIYKRMIQ